MNLHFLKKPFFRKRLLVSSCGRTDTGMKRRRNEDSFCIMRNRNIYIVADGMGGHNAGDVASKAAVDSLAQYYIDNKLNTLVNREAIRHTMIAGFIHANETIMAMAAEKDPLQGMGCTMIACYVNNESVHFCHVGDVRGYVATTKLIRQLTTDHSYAAQFRQSNSRDPKTLSGPPKNIISRAIGFPFKEDPEYNFSESHSGIRVFICSDGLWGMIDDPQLHDILFSAPSPEKACETFIERANEAGGKDNITVVSIFID
jgi:protein phosphatase